MGAVVMVAALMGFLLWLLLPEPRRLLASQQRDAERTLPVAARDYVALWFYRLMYPHCLLGGFDAAQSSLGSMSPPVATGRQDLEGGSGRCGEASHAPGICVGMGPGAWIIDPSFEPSCPGLAGTAMLKACGSTYRYRSWGFIELHRLAL